MAVTATGIILNETFSPNNVPPPIQFQSLAAKMSCELFSLLVVFLREILLWTVDVGKLIMACGWVVGAIV